MTGHGRNSDRKSELLIGNETKASIGSVKEASIGSVKEASTANGIEEASDLEIEGIIPLKITTASEILIAIVEARVKNFSSQPEANGDLDQKSQSTDEIDQLAVTRIENREHLREKIIQVGRVP